MAVPQSEHCVISIHNSHSPARNRNGKFVWSVDIVAEKRTHGRQVLDPWNATEKKNCRWYVEEFAAKQPYETTKARNAVTLLKTYASLLKQDLGLGEIVASIAKGGSGKKIISIEVYDECKRNTIHQLHWELLENPNIWEPKNVEVQIRRSIKPIKDCDDVDTDIKLWQQNPAAPRSFNILLVVARNVGEDSDLDPTFASSILTDLQHKFYSLGSSTQVNLEVVRPGTVDALEEHLERSRAIRGDGYFHLVHFDIHGKFDSEKCLAFLRFNARMADGTVSDELVDVEPSTIGEILSEYGITMVVLNACESARTEYGEDNNIAKIFARYGVNNIVAMSFIVLESAARTFLGIFYCHFIAERLDFSAAAALARQAIRRDPERSARFSLSLGVVDWFVPVVYCYGSPMRMKLREGGESFPVPGGILLPVDKKPIKDLGFIGRDFDILRLEKHLLRIPKKCEESEISKTVPAVWLWGRPGIGKTTLLQHIPPLWIGTSFMEIILYIDFSVHFIRNMDDFITELLIQLPTPTAATDDPLRETRGELVLRLIRDRRVCLMLDGLHVVTWADHEEYGNSSIISEINVFLKKLVKSQSQSINKTGICFFVFSGRVRQNYSQFDYCKDAATFELGGLNRRSCEDLLQSITRVVKPDLGYYELFSNLLEGTPASLIHFGNLARTSGYSIQEMYETIFNGDVDKSLLVGQNSHQCYIFQEMEQRFSTVSSEKLAVIITLGWYWHEGPVVKALCDTLMVSNICRDDFEIEEVLELVSSWGYIETSLASIVKEDDYIINWIHPLFTIYARTVACSLFQSKPDLSATGWSSSVKHFLSSVGEHAMHLIFPKGGLQLASKYLASAVGAYQHRYFDFHYYTFATWFLRDIDNNIDRGLPNFTAPQKGTDSNAVEAWGRRGLHNILFASKICLGQGAIVFSLGQWPMITMSFYVFSYRKVCTVAEVTLLANHFEKLLYKIQSQEGMVLDDAELHFGLGLACALSTIHGKYIPSFARTHIRLLDFGMKMMKLSEARYGPKPDLQKGLLYNLKAEVLLAEGMEEEAKKTWKKGIEIGRASLQSSMDAFQSMQRHGFEYDKDILTSGLDSMNQFYDNLDQAWDVVAQQYSGEMHPTKKLPKKFSGLSELHGDNLEHMIHELNKVKRKYDRLEDVESSGAGGGNSLIAVRHHQDFMRDAIRNGDLDQARTHRDVISRLLENDPTYASISAIRRSVGKITGSIDKPLIRDLLVKSGLNQAKYETEMMDLFLEVLDTDLYEANQEPELAGLIVEELD